MEKQFFRFVYNLYHIRQRNGLMPILEDDNTIYISQGFIDKNTWNTSPH